MRYAQEITTSDVIARVFPNKKWREGNSILYLSTRIIVASDRCVTPSTIALADRLRKVGYWDESNFTISQICSKTTLTSPAATASADLKTDTRPVGIAMINRWQIHNANTFPALPRFSRYILCQHYPIPLFYLLLFSLFFSRSFRVCSHPIVIRVFLASTFLTLSGHHVSLPVFQLPFFPHDWPISTYSSPISSLNFPSVQTPFSVTNSSLTSCLNSYDSS